MVLKRGKFLKRRMWVCFPKNQGGVLGRKRVPEIHCIVSDSLGYWGRPQPKRKDFLTSCWRNRNKSAWAWGGAWVRSDDDKIGHSFTVPSNQLQVEGIELGKTSPAADQGSACPQLLNLVWTP